MIIKYFDFIKNFFNSKSDFYLLYGENSALIEDTIEKFFKLNFSKNVFTYEENDILENVSSFKEQVYTKSFFEKPGAANSISKSSSSQASSDPSVVVVAGLGVSPPPSQSRFSLNFMETALGEAPLKLTMMPSSNMVSASN